MHRSHGLGVVLCTILVLAGPGWAMGATGAGTSTSRAVSPTSIESSVSISYVPADPGRMPLGIGGDVMSGGSDVPTAVVQLESSPDNASWSVEQTTTTLSLGRGYWFIPFHQEMYYYRARFIGKDAIAPSLSDVVHLPRIVQLLRAFSVTGPIAYDIKSRQKTQFVYDAGFAGGANAKLIVKGARSDGGDLVIFNGTIDQNGTVLKTWNGMDEKGQRLRYSANWTWQLTVVRNGRTYDQRSGTVIVCRILFSKWGTSVGGAVQKMSGYLRPGQTKCDLYMRTNVSSGDTVTLKLTGPNGFSVPSRSFAATPTIAVRHTTFGGASAPPYRGIYTMDISAKRNTYYSVTLWQ